MDNNKYNEKRKELTEKAESFIIERDENAEIVVDGKIDAGAVLLMEFVWSLYEDGVIDI